MAILNAEGAYDEMKVIIIYSNDNPPYVFTPTTPEEKHLVCSAFNPSTGFESDWAEIPIKRLSPSELMHIIDASGKQYKIDINVDINDQQLEQ